MLHNSKYQNYGFYISVKNKLETECSSNIHKHQFKANFSFKNFLVYSFILFYSIFLLSLQYPNRAKNGIKLISDSPWTKNLCTLGKGNECR